MKKSVVFILVVFAVKLYANPTLVLSSDSDFLISCLDGKNLSEKLTINRWYKPGIQINGVLTIGDNLIYSVSYSQKSENGGKYYSIGEIWSLDLNKNIYVLFRTDPQDDEYISFIRKIGNSIWFQKSNTTSYLYMYDLNTKKIVTLDSSKIDGKICNIWESSQERYFYTLENKNEYSSGEFYIVSDMCILSNQFSYQILDYSIEHQLKLIIKDKVILLQKSDESCDELKILKIKEILNSSFIYNDNTVFISYYTEKKDIIANFLFDSSNSIVKRTNILEKILLSNDVIAKNNINIPAKYQLYSVEENLEEN